MLQWLTKSAFYLFYLQNLEYLSSVKKCIIDTKLAALQAKRDGDLALARRFVQHVDIMCKEVAEAEANLAESREE